MKLFLRFEGVCTGDVRLIFSHLWRLYRNPKNRARVILSLAKDLLFFRTRVESELVFRNYKTKRQILRRSASQNDIATPPLTGGNKVRVTATGESPIFPSPQPSLPQAGEGIMIVYSIPADVNIVFALALVR